MVKSVIKVPIYDREIEVIIYDKQEEAEKFLGERGIEFKIGHYSGAALMNNETQEQVLMLDSTIEGFPDRGIIAHEAKHLVNDLFVCINYKLDMHNDEPEAYLLGYLVNEIHKIIDKHCK